MRTLRRRGRWLAPSALSAALLVAGVASLWLAFVTPMRTGSRHYELRRGRWSLDDGGRDLVALFYFLGPVLMVASAAHARLRARDLDETESEPDATTEPTLTGGLTLRRISLVAERSQALSLLDSLRAEPTHAHRSLEALATAMQQAGRVEHVERAVAEGELDEIVEAERRALERRIEPDPAATYRDSEPASAAQGGHVVLSWVIVTRGDVDPWVELPGPGSITPWLEEIVPVRPEDTVALDAFLTPRLRGMDEPTLAAALDLEPLA